MRVWLVALLALLIASPAAADELRPGYLAFTQTSPTAWQLVWKAPMRGGITPQSQPILPKGCTITRLTDHLVARGTAISMSDVRCTGPVAGGKIGLSNMEAAQTDVLARVAPFGVCKSFHVMQHNTGCEITSFPSPTPYPRQPASLSLA